MSGILKITVARALDAVLARFGADQLPQRSGAEARVGLVRADLAPRLEHLRTSALRALITS